MFHLIRIFKITTKKKFRMSLLLSLLLLLLLFIRLMIIKIMMIMMLMIIRRQIEREREREIQTYQQQQQKKHKAHIWIDIFTNQLIEILFVNSHYYYFFIWCAIYIHSFIHWIEALQFKLIRFQNCFSLDYMWEICCWFWILKKNT